MKRKDKKILGRRKGMCEYAEMGNDSVFKVLKDP